MSAVKKYLTAINTMMSPNKFRNKEWYYNGIYDFILREGKQYKSQKLTEDEKEKVMGLIDSFTYLFGEPKSKQCYYNSQMAAMTDSSFHYVEGYALASMGLPLAHAFLVINDKVVDLTWKHKDTNELIAGEHSLEYWGIPIHIDDIKKACFDTSMSQSHLEGWWNKGALYREKFKHGEPYYAK